MKWWRRETFYVEEADYVVASGQSVLRLTCLAVVLDGDVERALAIRLVFWYEAMGLATNNGRGFKKPKPQFAASCRAAAPVPKRELKVAFRATS
jgi:hypothetical protein